MDEAQASLLSALEKLEALITEAFPTDARAQAAARALAQHTADLVRALQTALVENKPLKYARQRLAIEAAMRKLAPEIIDALSLCDLLVAATITSPHEIDLLEALDERFGKPNPKVESIELALDVPAPAPIVADHNVLGVLIELGASLAQGATKARLVRRPIAGLDTLRIAPIPKGGLVPKTILFVPKHNERALTSEIAIVSGRMSGLVVEIDPAARSMSITSEAKPRSC